MLFACLNLKLFSLFKNKNRPSFEFWYYPCEGNQYSGTLVYMQKTLLIGVCITVLASGASSVEWDDKVWEIGGGVGFSSITTPDFESAPVFVFHAGVHIPLIVEQHLRASPQIQFGFIPVEPDKKLDSKGGNFISVASALYIEHDILFGSKPWWIGAAPVISASTVVNEYQWQSSSTGLKAIELDNGLSFAMGAAARLTIPLTNHLSTALVGQYSPMEGAFNSALFNVSFQF